MSLNPIAKTSLKTVRTHLRLAVVLLLVQPANAQRLERVAVQVNMGVGIGNKPDAVFGRPFFLTGNLMFESAKGWRVYTEIGTLAFRDVAYADRNFGFNFLPEYARSRHTFGGLRIGHSLVNNRQNGELSLSGGVDYLVVRKPTVTTIPGYITKYSFDYAATHWANFPVQHDVASAALGSLQVRVLVSGRWNMNTYHSFLTASIGISMPVYDKKRDNP